MNYLKHEIVIPEEPTFSFVNRDYSDLSFISRLLLVCKEPPKLQLKSDYIVTLSPAYLALMTARYDLGREWLLLKKPLPITALTGMITDLASIPRPLWSVPGFSPTGPLRYGALQHDPGYQYGYLLTPINDDIVYPQASWELYMKYQDVFGGSLMPVFVGAPKEFCDQLFADIVVAHTGATWIAGRALWALSKYGKKAWNNYRAKGPTAYGDNSLGLPGLLNNGQYSF